MTLHQLIQKYESYIKLTEEEIERLNTESARLRERGINYNGMTLEKMKLKYTLEIYNEMVKDLKQQF